MSYPGGNSPQGQPQPGQWPGAPGQQAGQPYDAPQPYGQSSPQHQQAPQQPYGQPQQFGQQPAPQFGGPPGQFGQQQWQRQGPPAPPGITVNTSYLWTAFLLGLLVKPKIKINGQQVPNTRWGDNHIPVGPGTYHVWIATPWLFDMGPGEMPVQVGPGPGARVYYKPPAVFFLKGAIGFGPQKTPGILLVWLPLAIVAVLTVLLFVLALAASV
ncbi:hypothetical protein OG225_35010 [Nocardia sp. NBC_01377]|uniref:hypothetical protein n=1 Tax=Nocardia sp. NBC_01377 TaxID=2903595 RepID=UPI00324B4A32